MNASAVVRKIGATLVIACVASSLAFAQVPIREPTQVIDAPPDPDPGSQPIAYFAHGIAKHKNTLLLAPASSQAAYLYTRANRNEPWTYSAKLSLPADAGGIYDVELEADTAVITGGYSLDLALVFVFKREAAEWRLVQTIAEPLPQAPFVGGTFGYRLGLSGGTLAIANFLAESSKGAVYVYKRHPSGHFEFQQQLVGATEGASFGWDVAIQRRTLLVSNPSDRVLVFYKHRSGWVQEDALLPPSDPAPYSFGMRVALDGNTAAVSRPWGETPGAVYAYRRMNGRWTFEATLTNPYSSAFGESVAVQGDKIASNAWGSWTTDHLLVFERADGEWTPSEMLLAPLSGYGFGLALHWSGRDLLTSANSLPTPDPRFEGQVFHYVIP